MSGYSGTPLAKKLGIKEGFKIILLNQPDYYLDLFESLPSDIELLDEGTQGQVDFIHFFTKSEEELQSKILDLKSKLKPSGMIWVSWPKKASKVPTDVDDSIVRKVGLESGLVDVKVCAVDEVWSGLKFVFRLKDRI
ncbi:DUF3052 family protein [Roseivirga echinicomitans]|uniref:DUF3052 domain-containing protein n=1 Tax=Roseivirga echinicomitans TaxID=296218 RepID=A0A150XK88_9BACT|nr:DUF3052 family protein [Roseivirga echinicomitans]KYG79157.1 hypothetical protein AWN68_17980 [Roseivirga echinicomitans]